MSFIWPVMLYLLIFLPLLVMLYLRSYQRRQQLVGALSGYGMLPGAARAKPGIHRHIPPLFFLVSLTILIIALARPQAVVSLPRIEGTVILAFDVSGSMAADDLKPTRMDAAKAAVLDFVQRQPTTVQIGVVAFSDNGFSVQAPTNDQGPVLAAINRLTPQRGTSLANGILASLSLLLAANGQQANYYSNLTPTPELTPTPMPVGSYTSSVIILLTDGENNENPDPMDAAKAAADRGVRIYTVGIGSPTGANVHVDGYTIHTQLDQTTLQQISQLTGGSYYNADSEEDLRAIYDQLTPQLVIKADKMEITPLFAGASIFVLLIGGMISLLWFGRMP